MGARLSFRRSEATSKRFCSSVWRYPPRLTLSHLSGTKIGTLELLLAQRALLFFFTNLASSFGFGLARG